MNWDFLLRNVGNTLTPELVQGLMTAVQGHLAECYKHSYAEALKSITEYEGQFGDVEVREERLPGNYLFRLSSYEQEQGRLGEMQRMYMRELRGKVNGGLAASLGHGEAVRRERAHQLVMFLIEVLGEPVGYLVFTSGRYPETDELIAREMHFYILPEHRRGWLALRFFRFAERALRAAGVKRVLATSTYTKDITPLYRRLGFVAHESVSTKEL